MPLTTSDTVAVDDTTQRWDAPKIKAVLHFDTEDSVLHVELVVVDTTNDRRERSVSLETDATVLTGFEANFATHYATVKTAVDEMIKDYLDALAYNIAESNTFTIV
jgi:hypothetical protein